MLFPIGDNRGDSRVTVAPVAEYFEVKLKMDKILEDKYILSTSSHRTICYGHNRD